MTMPSVNLIMPKKQQQPQQQQQFKAISAIRMPMALAMQTLHISEKRESTDSATSSRNGSICDEKAPELRRHASAPQLDKASIHKKKFAQIEKGVKQHSSFDTVSLPKTILGRFKHLTCQ
ncbi:unnamed protein product, partial [Mesorhabditis belari]|uniref:Uncharacterized protein n=1 Tax=Mesorhabditis belari TaxID=2138241 RepID=A0AAF3FNP2_9BILA